MTRASDPLAIPTEKLDALLAAVEGYSDAQSLADSVEAFEFVDIKRAAVRTAALDWGEALLEEAWGRGTTADPLKGLRELRAALRAMRGGGGA